MQQSTIYIGWFPMTLIRHYQRLQNVLLIIHWWKFGNSSEKKNIHKEGTGRGRWVPRKVSNTILIRYPSAITFFVFNILGLHRHVLPTSDRICTCVLPLQNTSRTEKRMKETLIANHKPVLSRSPGWSNFTVTFSGSNYAFLSQHDFEQKLFRT